MSELTREQVVENITRLQMHYSYPISFAIELLAHDAAQRGRIVLLEEAVAGRPADLKDWAQRHCSPMREVDLDPLDGSDT